MKVTIELAKYEVIGLKKYLKSVSHDINPKITKKDIVEEIKGMVNGELQAGACGDDVKEEYRKHLAAELKKYGTGYEKTETW